jgi:hypothetical protein
MHSHARTSAKIDANSYFVSSSSYSFSGNRAAKFSKKKFVLTYLGIEVGRLGVSLSEQIALSCGDIVSPFFGERAPLPLCHAPRGTHLGKLFGGGAEKSGRGARAPAKHPVTDR